MAEKEWDSPHRRFNPLLNGWILCSPHRAKRPWQGQLEKPVTDQLPQYDPKCFLCPRNKRAQSDENPDYKDTFCFTNDYSALLAEQHDPLATTPVEKSGADSLFQSSGVSGVCKVICFSPRHDLTLSQMDVPDIVKVVQRWTAEYLELCKNPQIEYVLIFENRGEMMGCSNPHPHCQIWSSSFVPQDPTTEINSMHQYFVKNHSCMLCDYARSEMEKGVRVVTQNESFLAVVPYWALWPYEVLLLSKRHLGSLADFSEKEVQDFSDLINKVTCKFDNLFSISFPYSMGIHQSPTPAGMRHVKDTCDVHFHVHFFPPLLRSATIKKFMVGYELLGEPQRDITAEQSANTLRQLSETVRYNKK